MRGNGSYESMNWKNGTVTAISNIAALKTNEPTKNQLFDKGILQIGVPNERKANDIKSESSAIERNIILLMISIGKPRLRT